MSAIEKHFVQIFDRKKRIIEHARQESRLWEHHLLPKLILNGIPPPPWLTHSDAKDLNRHEVVSEGLLSRTQFGIPFTGQQCSLYSNLDAVFNDVQYPVGLRNEVCAFKNDGDTGRRLSILPDCSVNNAGCASSDPPELDSGAISPQNQIEPRVSESFHDPVVSLAKLQRSRSRQKALEERNSAKASKRLSGDGDNAGDWTAAATGSAPPSLQEDHIKDLSLVNEFQPNSQGEGEISVNSAEKENIAEVGASRNTRAVTSQTKEGQLISSSIDGGSLLAESLYIKADVAEKDLDVQENIASDVNSTDNAEHRSAATNAKVHLDFDGLVDNEPSCLGSRLTTANTKVREDASVLRLSPDFAVSVIPKQLVFDDGKETNRDGINSLDLKEGRRRMSPDKEPPALSEPLKLLDDIQEVLADSFSEAVTENGLLRHSDKSVTNFNARFSSGSPTDDTNVDLARQAPNTICPGQNGDLLPQALLSNGKVTSFSTDCHNFISSTDSFTNNVEHSCSQHKRRKVEIETEKFLPDSTLLAEKLVDSIDQRPASGTSSIKEDNPEAVIVIEGCRRMSPNKEPPALSEPLKLLDDIQEVLADSFSEAVTENGLLRHSDKSVTNFNARFSSGSPTDDTNVDLAQQAPNTICSGQNGDLLPQALLSNGKVTSFSTDCHNFKNSTDSFTNNVEHSCSQHKRRKVEIEKEKFLPDSTLLAEKLVDSIDQRPANGTSSIKEDNPEAVIEVQHLAHDQADDIGDQHASNSPTDVMEDTKESQKMEGSSVKVRKEEKLILDGRGRSSDTLMLPEANPFSFSIDSMRFSMDEKAGSWHLEVNSGQDSAEHLTCVERSTSSRRINPGGDTEFSDGLSVSPRLRDLNLIGTGEALPEFEGFLMQTDNVQPCTARDEMELESMSLPSNSGDYTSLGRSRFIHSPSCYSSTPYKLHSLANLYQSLPNGLLEGYGLRTSRPANDGSPRSLSDCRPNCNGRFTSSVQTLWDRFNSNFGSSGKRKSSKPELPCISEENENVDEIAGTFQKGIGSEGITRSIARGLLADIVDNAESKIKIVDNANPSTSVLQDALASGRKDSLSSEFNFDGTPNKIKKKPDMQNGNGIRFANKGKENKSVVNGAKRNSESVRKRSSRSKLSGKNSMKDPVNGAKRNSESVRKRSSKSNLSGKISLKQRCPTFSGGKSTRSNIVSNLTSFIPLVQQKQAAAVFTGKRNIKVPSLIKAEAAKRNADIKANEQKKRKEFMMEQQKKKKEEEEMAAKEKKQREIEEKKEKDRKRKAVNDMKLQEHGKIHAKKARAAGEEVHESRKIIEGRDNCNNLLLQEHNRQGNVQKISETEPLTISDSANNITKESCYDKSESVSECANKGKAKMVDLIKAVEDNDSIIKNSLQEQSYEMSPYRSDDDEDDDDVPNNKFMPSWASKHSLSMIISSQKMDPETIFPRQSFCDIAKVLLPRRLLL